MILPSKHGDVDRSLFVLGAHLLRRMREPRELGSLWAEVHESGVANSFNRFYNSIVLLFIIGAIEEEQGLLVLNRNVQ